MKYLGTLYLRDHSVLSFVNLLTSDVHFGADHVCSVVDQNDIRYVWNTPFILHEQLNHTDL